MKSFDPPFYADETVRAQVVQITRYFALLNVRGWMMPLHRRWMSRNIITHPSELFSIGDRIDVVVHHINKPHPCFVRNRYYGATMHGYWVSLWPLQPDPKAELWGRYPEGSVVEVEIVGYIYNRNVRVKFPDGLEVDLKRGDIFPRHLNEPQRSGNYQVGERFKLVMRNHWVQPYRSKGRVNDLAEAGFITPKIANEKRNNAEIKRIQSQY